MNQDVNPLAEDLNRELMADGSKLCKMLSTRGKKAFFPFKGILGQGAEAQGAAINATIGTAAEDDGSPLCLECLEELVTLPSTAYLYASSFGLAGLRDTWQEMLTKKNPTLQGKSFSKPVVTAALTHGLSVAGYLFMDHGDQVILPDLYWDNYGLLFEAAYWIEFSTYPMFKNRGFNFEGLEAKLAEPGERKIVILNFPNNPTGYTATEQDAEAIERVLLAAATAGKELVVILDDAYFGLVYEPGVSKESLFARLCDLHPNLLAVKLDGPTKEDYVWGFRVGFITFGSSGATARQYQALEAKVAGVVRGSISNVSSIGQHLLMRAYKSSEYAQQKALKYETLKHRYQHIREIFALHSEYGTSFVPMPFNSGYFMCVKPLGVDPEEVRKRLLEKHSVGVIVLSGLLRIAYSSVPYVQLDRLFAAINDVVQELQQKAHN